MSRIGRAPIVLPTGVSFEIANGYANVKGPKGVVSAMVHPEIEVTREDGQLVLTRPSDSTRHKSLHGLTRALLANAVVGVQRRLHQGPRIARRRLPRRSDAQAAQHGARLFAPGQHSAARRHHHGSASRAPPPWKTVSLPPPLTIRSHDRQILGDFAADVRSRRPVEPYKGKGLRYRDEIVKRKQGKQTKGDKKKVMAKRSLNELRLRRHQTFAPKSKEHRRAAAAVRQTHAAPHPRPAHR